MGAALAFVPGEKFVSLSITGSWCALKCSFCGARYLYSMDFAESLEKLRDLMHYYYRAGTRGFLISGGFTEEGYLPVTGELLDFLREFRRGREVFLSVHLGLAPRDLVDKALEVFDLVDFEVPPSEEYVRSGRGLSASLEDYLKTLEYVTAEYGEDRVAPHVVLNSPFASWQQELEVLRRVGAVHRRIAVLLLYASGAAPEEARVLEAARVSRSLFGEVSLGCMRPRGRSALVERLVSGGYLDRVANPGSEVVKKLGMRVVRACCSIPRSAFGLFE